MRPSAYSVHEHVLGSSEVETSLNTLPEFDAPPLDEVVVGIQFQPVPAYQQIRAFEVWQLFRDQFPVVQELPPLNAQFETFGLPAAMAFPFNIFTGASHDRFWFLKEPGHQLIQFQQDRLLHNWRKLDVRDAEYPRFESIVDQFRKEMLLLQTYFGTLGNERLIVTQCELSYLNHIGLDDLEAFSPQTWFAFVDPNQPPVDEFACTAKHVLKDRSGKPYGRLYRESVTAADNKGRKLLTLNLTARGRPEADTIDGALDFLERTRHMIADEFVGATTSEAHKRWKRVR
jgi:uncharacterized protein (TIGR04255 family)